MSEAAMDMSTAAPVRALPISRVMQVLVRREFWEHRALWLVPLIVAVLTLLGAAIGSFNFNGLPLPVAQQGGVFGLAIWGLGWPQYVTIGIVLWFYLSDCLYAERRDRSILFWRSMPVSDTATVLSKLITAMVVVPLGVYLVTLVTSLLVSGIWSLRAAVGTLHGVTWDTATWLHVMGDTLLGVIASVLWYAPIGAYLLLLSAWARRQVQVWILVPPLVAALLERLVLGTHLLTTLLVYRLGGVWSQMNKNGLFTSMDPVPIFRNIDLWLGLIAAVVFVVAAIRLRRYRDDT
jgi:ABC-2 type transport system permease protein